MSPELGIVEEVRALNQKMDRLFDLLEGDKYNPGFFAQVNAQGQQIQKIWEQIEYIEQAMRTAQKKRQGRRTQAIWAAMFIPIFTVLLSMVVISDIRHQFLTVSPWVAVALTAGLFFISMSTAAIVAIGLQEMNQ